MLPRIPLLLTLFFCLVLSNGGSAQQDKQSTSTEPVPVYIPPTTQGGWKITAEDTGGAFSVEETFVKPGTEPSPYRHNQEDEGFYILEGQYEFKIGDHLTLASVGSFLFVPGGIPHMYKNNELPVTEMPKAFGRNEVNRLQEVIGRAPGFGNHFQHSG